jgi:hypothetical protein
MGKLPSEGGQHCELANGSHSGRKKRHREPHLPKKLSFPMLLGFYPLLREVVEHR